MISLDEKNQRSHLGLLGEQLVLSEEGGHVG
jgi:hypothetical protein